MNLPRDISYANDYIRLGPGIKLDDLGYDSLDIVHLEIQIEDEFGIEIPSEDEESFLNREVTPQKICDYVRSKVGRQKREIK